VFKRSRLTQISRAACFDPSFNRAIWPEVLAMLTTAEVRWFWQGHCPRQLHEWFFQSGISPGGGQSRTDKYIPQIDQPEINVKARGDDEELEIKGLVARTAWPLDALAPHVEIWCEWSCRIPGLRLADAAPIPIKKTRWIRQFDTSNSELVEISLGPDEKPKAGSLSPVQGCSAELTEVSSANLSEAWKGSFGLFDSALFGRVRQCRIGFHASK
jgi:hypothetical protein